MRLMDVISLAGSGKLSWDKSLKYNVQFGRGQAHDLAGQISAAEARFVLERDVTETACSLIREAPDSILRAADVLRVPYRTTWVEVRSGQHLTFGQPVSRSEIGFPNALSEVLDRFERACGLTGWFIEADESGRRGRITLTHGSDFDALKRLGGDDANERLAASMRHGSPVVVAGTLAFDLDRESETLEQKFSVASVWGADVQINGITLPVKLAPSEKAGKSRRAFPPPSFKELKILLAFLALFGAKGAVERTPVDLTKVNKNRALRGQPPLHTYEDVTMYVPTKLEGGTLTVHANDDSERSGRASPRAHFVRRHLVTRGGKVFWRQAHARGDCSKGWVGARIVRHPKAA